MSYATGLNTLSALAAGPSSPKMPVLFIGHGNPMNAIEHNSFHQSWQALGKRLPRPSAILSISAHWLTDNTSVTAMEHPKTIHDFGGFPRQLFEQQYPAPGSPQFAKMTAEAITLSHVQNDQSWGLDHGTWSVLLPMFPLADIPVIQLSIVYNKPLDYHWQIGEQLKQLRNRGVLILGSGNIVHNLGMIDFQNTGIRYGWAEEFDARFKKWIDENDRKSMLQYQQIMGALATKAHPSNDHLLPLYYILGLREKGEALTYFNEQFDLGSISMRSFIIGNA
ncbi:MAG: 4,5-DOPA dioxygenase extradiol [Chitinophagia bacterium]|nr:4,5-DOPA dioxygenase extradiol [Chitinophagia bacterium]